MPKDNLQVASVYLHVGNSGATFSVTDKSGPTIEIYTSSFGNLGQTTEIHTTLDGLIAVRDMLSKAIDIGVFGAPYCHAAHTINSIDTGDFDDGDV
jgi:hypothetical protein